MKKSRELISILLIAILFFSFLPMEAFAKVGIGKTFTSKTSSDFAKVVANDGDTVLYTSVLNPIYNELNLIVSPKTARNIFTHRLELHSFSGLTEVLNISLSNKSLQRKKIGRRIRDVFVINLSNDLSYTTPKKAVPVTSLPSDEYLIRQFEPGLIDITSSPFTIEPPALIAGKITAMYSGVAWVSVETLSGERISDGLIGVSQDGTFITEVRANHIIDLLEKNNSETATGVIHVQADKDFYAFVVLNNDPESNTELDSKVVELNDATTLAVTLAKKDQNVADTLTEEKKSEEGEVKEGESGVDLEDEEKIECDINKFASECDLDNNEILTKIGTSFKDFLRTTLCKFEGFEPIREAILATPDETNLSIGRGYCEFFGRTEDSNEPCKVYAQILKEFKKGDILGLPCPPEFCNEFANIKPPQCFDVIDFCEEKEDALPTRNMERICRGKRCFDLPQCITKPKKDLFCKKIETEITEKECLEGDTDRSFTIVEAGNLKYCIPSKENKETIVKECELRDCHIKCETSSPEPTPKIPSDPPDPPFVFPPGTTSSTRLQTSAGTPICEEEQISTPEKPCRCAKGGSLIDGQCLCGPTAKHTNEGCKRICSSGQGILTAFPCECAKGGKFAGIIELGILKPGKHTVEIEAVIEKPGCSLSGETFWNGDVTLRTTVNQCDSLPENCLSNTIQQLNFLVQCEANDNLCKPRHKIELTIQEETPLEFEFTSGSNCSPIKLNVYVDEKLVYNSPLLGFPGNNAGPLKIGGRDNCECPDGSQYTEKGCPEKKEEPVKPVEPEKPKTKEETEKCHLKCDAEFGRKADCSNPNSEFYSVKCCDEKIQETIVITDPEEIDEHLSCFGLGGPAFCDAGRTLNRVSNTQSLKKCFCESKDNFNEKGLLTNEARESCKDICPEGFIQDEKGECIGTGKEEECPKGQERDPKTGECIDKGTIAGGDNICPPGTGPSKTIQCICQKPALPGSGECKCPEGAIYAGIDGCKKIEGTEGEAICPAGTGPSKTIPCKCKEPATPTGIGNECTCEEGKVYAGEKGCIDKEAEEIPICTPGQFKSVIIPCKCARGADFNEEGLCKCLNGKEYSIDGCGDIEAKICLPGENAKKTNCICAGGAKIGATGFCKCKEEEEYTAGGCIPIKKSPTPTPKPSPTATPKETPTATPKPSPTPKGTICTSTEKPSSTGCNCASGASPGSSGICECKEGESYTTDGCTTTFCSVGQVSKPDDPCACKGTATPTGANGECVCPNGNDYSLTLGGCGD